MKKILGITLLICGLIPLILAQCNEEKARPKFKRSVYEFTVELLTRVAQEKENHFVTSAFSVWSALACASLGAAGYTLAEFEEVLNLHKRKCFNKQYLSLASKVAINDDADIDIQKSSSVFVDERFVVKDEFKNKVESTGLSSIENMAFYDAELAAQKINDYVIRATRNTIDGVVAPSDIEKAVMIIIDTIFFKGNWQKPFDHKESAVVKFYDEQENAIGDVKIMVTTDTFRLGTVPLLNAQVLELPYGNKTESRYSMLIFLPEAGESLDNVIDNLKKVSLTSIKYLLEEYGERRVVVQLPRFKISSDLSNLKELLADMGLKSMFGANAQFPDISNLPIYVSNFIQKATIEVNEEGSTASAATRVDFSFRSNSLSFNARKPFFYMIVDKEFEIPLFAGAYSKPSVY